MNELGTHLLEHIGILGTLNTEQNMKKYSTTKLKITHKSNIIILDVPSQNSDNLVNSLKNSGLVLE